MMEFTIKQPLMKMDNPVKPASVPLIALVHALSHEGRGIASVAGKTVFIEGALPNETVSFVIHKRHKRYDEAKVVEILKPCIDRIQPRCPHFNQCGGCSLQHMEAAAQIHFKQQVV